MCQITQNNIKLMITKQLFKDALILLINLQKKIENLHEIGIDIRDSQFETTPYAILESWIQSSFEEPEASAILDWIYDRIFDPCNWYDKNNKLDDKKVNIKTKEGETLVDDFNSLCEYFSIK